MPERPIWTGTPSELLPLGPSILSARGTVDDFVLITGVTDRSLPNLVRIFANIMNVVVKMDPTWESEVAKPK